MFCGMWINDREACSALLFEHHVKRQCETGFIVAALNYLKVFACDILNAYLNVPCKYKIWFASGIECGQISVVKLMKLVIELNSHKFSGA